MTARSTEEAGGFSTNVTSVCQDFTRVPLAPSSGSTFVELSAQDRGG